MAGAFRLKPFGILGNIGAGDPAAGLIPLPQPARPNGAPLMQIDLAPATAQAIEKMRADLHAPPRWSVSGPSVNLSDAMRQKTDDIAREFYDRTGRNLTVTSGFRTPAAQARAMYDKFAGGDSKTYVGPSGREIRAIYDEAVAAQRDKAAALEAMAAKIAQQLAAGRPVSHHLSDRGLDFSIRQMGKGDLDILRDIIRRHAGRPLDEGTPPHLHGSFPQGAR